MLLRQQTKEDGPLSAGTRRTHGQQPKHTRQHRHGRNKEFHVTDMDADEKKAKIPLREAASHHHTHIFAPPVQNTGVTGQQTAWFLKPGQNERNEIDSEGNWPTQSLVRVGGNEMDVRRPRRRQNSDVASLMDSALLKEKRRGAERSGGKTRFVFDCVGLQRRQDTYCTCEGISPLLF